MLKRNNIKRYFWIFVFFLGFYGCGESLEDTYRDMAGDGPRRYLGKCTDLTVRAGWECLRVSWINGIDPVVKNIKMTWSSNDVKGDTILPREQVSCDIPHLQDGNYEIRVCGVDEKENTSMETIGYGRPYTLDHEIVMTFSRIVSKHFFVGNRLVLFFESLPENISDIKLHYTNADQVKREIPLGTEEIGAKYMLLPEEIDPSKDVVIERKGHVEDSFDVIPLPEYKLTREASMSVDFKMALEAKYGVDIDEAFVQDRTELELDYSLNSFEDILYFPKLEKLYLGKNRFLWDDKGYQILETYGAASEVFDLEKSLFVLNVARQLLELKVERYNRHYLPADGELDYVMDKPNPEAPIRGFFTDMRDWDISCSIEDIGNYNSYLDRLFDGNLNSAWQPEFNSTAETYQITVDMKNSRLVQGIQVAQRRFDPTNDWQYLDLMPSLITIEYSRDKIYWYKTTNMDGNTLGNTVGEITEICFPESRNARYLRFTVSDLPTGSNFTVSLAEIKVF